ncbi:hypothetical protein CLOM_g246 [Closterium sp. NIES-68]|nr:hypothetical protein CLOM_g246 [Closterium sp. NIES-68]GJP86341.1 hypothetical protein CLOP_g16373 [Closterium sp. NIES-67]
MSSAPFYAVAVSAESDGIFSGGPSSLSAPLEIRPTLMQRFKSIDWLDWFSAIGMLFLMYGIFLSYFYGLLAAAEAIRGENFRVLPQKYYGAFQYGTDIPQGYSTYPVGFPVPWNATLF